MATTKKSKEKDFIFISYSRNNLEEIKKCKEELEAKGFNCWMDLDGIESGEQNFKKVIIPAITESKAFLFFLTTESQKSDYAVKELNFAIKKEKRAIIVRINDDLMTDLFLFDYSDRNIIDWRKSEQKQKLLNDLRTWVDEDRIYKNLSGNIFITYRRSSLDDARLLQQALKARGYNVFFDYDSLKDEKFDDNIYKAIDESDVYILLLTKGTLDNCSREGDFVRHEIEYALARKKKIVPVKIADSDWEWPTTLPESIRGIKALQISEIYKNSLFEESVDKLIEDRFPEKL